MDVLNQINLFVKFPCFYFIHVGVLLVHKSLNHVYSASEETRKEHWNPLKLELKVTMSFHVDAENQIQVL